MDHVCIGIPRGLLFHEFGSLWTAFFAEARVPVIVSGETDKQVLDKGTMLAVDESCLPLKVYLGHIASLLPECSHIFAPRVAGFHQGFHFCAKFAGLPDIIYNTFGLPQDRIIAPNIENNSYVGQLKAVSTVCSQAGIALATGHRAYRKALKLWQSSRSSGIQPVNGKKIAVISHNYILEDSFFCRNVFNTLTAQGAAVITSSQVPNAVLYGQAEKFAPDIYWQLSAKIAGAARFFCTCPDIAGVVLLSSFGCGPDSLINEYLEHHELKPSGKPYMILNLDEHTGDAGVITRIEAFWDLVNWRSRSCEGHLSSHGIYNHSHTQYAGRA